MNYFISLFVVFLIGCAEIISPEPTDIIEHQISSPVVNPGKIEGQQNQTDFTTTNSSSPDLSSNIAKLPRKIIYHTDFSDAVIDDYSIEDEPLGFSDWGRPGEKVANGIRVFIDPDETGLSPSGESTLSSRCELSYPYRFEETQVGFEMEIEVTSSFKPDWEEHQEVIFQLHGTDSPNLSLNVTEDSLHADIRWLSPHWSTATKSSKIAIGPGIYKILVLSYPTKNSYGYFHVYVNGEFLISHLGPTIYPDEAKNGLRAQFGIYKADWNNEEARVYSQSIGIGVREYIVRKFTVFKPYESVE